ncbi:hypothetical protein ACJJIF_02610 [Microbulbifer sp. SSSA002]|uniref:hypothetical protein n=1 Tax=Microbulbifer sp. SSSA002 TaxID=3243376 RepID=UPI004039E721
MIGFGNEKGIVYLLDKPFIEEKLDFSNLNLWPTESKEVETKLREKEGYYNVGWSNQLHRIITKQAINSEQVNQFKKIAKTDLFLDVDWMLCGHYPPYAIELYSGDLLYFKTSLCFQCDNWINEVQGKFVRLRLFNNHLFDWFNKVIPLPDGYSEA